jgi:hypothetical protein
MYALFDIPGRDDIPEIADAGDVAEHAPENEEAARF